MTQGKAPARRAFARLKDALCRGVRTAARRGTPHRPHASQANRRATSQRVAGFLALCLALPALLLPAPASAHRGHDALSVIEIAPDGSLTVSHRLEAHDVEPALAAIAPNAQPSLDDPYAVAALRRYVLGHFLLAAHGKPVALTVRKVDIGVEQVRIELSGRIGRKERSLALSSTILQDIYPGQVNQVLIHIGKLVRTLRFTSPDVQSVALR